MKKKLGLLLVSVFVLLGVFKTISLYGEKIDALGLTKDSVTVKIGVSPVPHEEIAKIAREELKKEGVNLEIVVFDDYVQPNLALKDKDLHLNFFQHVPYLEKFNKENGTKLTSIGAVHIEPIAFYSTKVKKLEELKEGAEILIPNDATNGARALFLLSKNNLIKLKEGVELPTVNDIIENNKKIKFTEVESALIPGSYKEVDGAIINSNYAIASNLNPVKDGIVIEDKESNYANVIVTTEDLKKDENLKKVYKAFTSDKVKKFIEEKYKGSIVPTF